MLRLRDTDQEIAGALDSEHVRQPFKLPKVDGRGFPGLETRDRALGHFGKAGKAVLAQPCPLTEVAQPQDDGGRRHLPYPQGHSSSRARLADLSTNG